jgi:uncharacterized peroxidase-related enzyme
MSKITTPKPDQIPAESKPTLDMFTRSLGFTPNMLATFALSPIAFNAWATLSGPLGKAFDAKTRAGISLAVSEVNGCNYCLMVHSYTAERMTKLLSDEIILARKGHATDPKQDAAIQFARKVIETLGKASEADLHSVREAGYTDANVMEIVALVAKAFLTNFFNNVFDPDKDFPPVAPAGST